MEFLDKEKLVKGYREVFPTPNDLVTYLKYDDDLELLTIASDYNCFNDFYEKWDDDIDDWLGAFDLFMLLNMKKDLEQLNYKVDIKEYKYLTAILND